MSGHPEPAHEDLWRQLAPQVLGAVVRRYGHFDLAEDAVQEALLAAATQWPEDGLPDDPRGWLITVAARRLIDQLRTAESRRRREESVASLDEPMAHAANGAVTERDDTLLVLLMCCHPDLSTPSQIALTLRAVGGLTTEQIARAFLVPVPTMGQRISRAKQTIRASGSRFDLPAGEELRRRLDSVLHVIYLIFNEGYAATSGRDLQRPDLTAEATRLARMAHDLFPTDGEVTGLLALILLTDARRPARTAGDGSLVALADQDRSRWDTGLIAEGIALVTGALTTSVVGPYQLQAAIAAVHDESPSADDTDWPQILALYELLRRIQPGPVVELNRAVAVAMVHGARAGLAALDAYGDDLGDQHRWHAVRGHLLQLDGQLPAAEAALTEAARLTTSMPERRYLLLQLAGLGKVSRSGGSR